MTILEFFYVSLGTYYLATAFVDIVMGLLTWDDDDQQEFAFAVGRFRWLNRKPFNCVLCMSFYFGILLIVLVQNASITFTLIPAVAGAALIMSKIHQRLGTFI